METEKEKISVYNALITDWSDDTTIEIKRVLTSKEKDDIIIIDHNLNPPSEITFPTDSISILKKALEMFEDETL